MLDLTGRPAVPSTLAMQALLPAAQGEPSYADLLAHTKGRSDLSETTRSRYVSAIERAIEIQNRPAEGIEADLEALAARFPVKGFDLEHWDSETGYQTFRRRLQAALKSFLGVHAEKARLRAMEDEWSGLLAAIEPLTKGKVGGSAAWHPMKYAMLKSFALIARSYGWQPRDLSLERTQQIDRDFTGNVREAHARVFRRLDELRQFPQLLPFLPTRPIAFVPAVRAPDRADLLQDWEDQFLPWIAKVTKTGWDPVSKSFSDDHVKHAHVMRSAFRTALRAGLDIGVLTYGDTDLLSILACDETLCAIAGELFSRKALPKSQGHLEPRTARKYLKAINQVRAHLGIDVTQIRLVLANNVTAREGRKADKDMTKRNRQFCERLVETPHLRRRFLLSFQTLRDAAEEILGRAKREERALTAHELSEVRMLGVSACFAAIEIGGAPIRRSNAMALTCVEEDAQIRIPNKGKTPMRVFIPAMLTKNRVGIEFPIKWNRFGTYDTIRWYLETIRPLFPHAGSSPYLFPAIRAEGRPLEADFFAAKFSQLMRTVVDFPMTPHQMRHGQTSLLINKYPNEIEVIARRIDDTPDTLRQYYGWLNSLKLVERGQDMMIGLIDD